MTDSGTSFGCDHGKALTSVKVPGTPNLVPGNHRSHVLERRPMAASTARPRTYRRISHGGTIPSVTTRDRGSRHREARRLSCQPGKPSTASTCYAPWLAVRPGPRRVSPASRWASNGLACPSSWSASSVSGVVTTLSTGPGTPTRCYAGWSRVTAVSSSRPANAGLPMSWAWSSSRRRMCFPPC